MFCIQVLSTCPFFCFFHFSDNRGQKLWQKPRISPSPNYQYCSWACGAWSLRTTTLKLGEGVFFRSRLCNAEKQCFCQDILFGVVAILLVLAIIGFLLSPLLYFNLVTFRGTLMDISTFNILVSICSNMFCTTNKIIF